ncbi:hypothetical protein BCR37DRAFT_369309 [Protomyces lactucae-debilis]|uniref:Histone deacetylase interacting domain-containing protein n=1 Tax=Protomyces lactucae-debilis TaxID=2754530 RepID=A0A1Y2F935_PROLT|nr:uncharacterized protein BCR37DRAFT_369309 [Protomyces lactucae-debilis]ORY80409.1 hypothetical protein BCR37DRAFT_369309 [Protomyces lactucae-debilis]
MEANTPAQQAGGSPAVNPTQAPPTEPASAPSQPAAGPDTQPVVQDITAPSAQQPTAPAASNTTSQAQPPTQAPPQHTGDESAPADASIVPVPAPLPYFQQQENSASAVPLPSFAVATAGSTAAGLIPAPTSAQDDIAAAKQESPVASARRETSPGTDTFPAVDGSLQAPASAGTAAQTQAQQQQSAATQQTILQAAQRAADQGYRPLNVKDALSYLDQVKIRFFDQPDVYNRFLDIMKDFKSQSIDTPGVIERVSTLFRGHPELVQGFNTFLPPGYRIECSSDPSDPNPIRVTTPQGTVNQVNGQHGGPTRFSAPVAPGSTATGQGTWRTDDQYAQNAAYGMTMVSQAANQGPPSNGSTGNLGNNGNGGEKKPVEFNHAINYVNKIKTRFSNEPDTYKHFLEILQTYQKDARPIQEVYSQVTELFKGAQDLLQDFKQFLPENNAGASAAARMPAVGTFAPPQQASAPTASSTRGDKKRRPAAEPQRGSGAKKGKSTHRQSEAQSQQQHAQQQGQQQGPVSPNLLPSAPEPLHAMHARASANVEELAFFERAKKYINNKATTVEFFKVLNLFTQEIIDKNTLVERIDAFIGQHKDLMDQFKKIVNYTGADETFENLPATTRPKVDLSLCKAFGPSYRQLPKSETLLPCSGRDDMCWEVLNDVYVSHPTWASEDAGFVAHKKNQYEEALHKIEEERYEYDLNIEANLRTIQLLEPIAQRISTMMEEEKRQFKLPPGLGGQSIAIYQKVIKKIYDKERGQEVIDQIHENPVIAVPVVLKRLKQKDEEWKRAQREWNKVWRETEAKNYYKSLDHQGVYFKTIDKKSMMARNLISEIETLRRMQAERRVSPAAPRPAFQYEYNMRHHDICIDIRNLLTIQIERMSVSAAERERMLTWSTTFIPLFFGIDASTIVESIGGEAESLSRPTGGVSTRRKKAGEEVDLLKSIMKRTREAVHRRNKQSADGETPELESQPPSRVSTPALDKDSDADAEASQDTPMVDEEETPDTEDAINLAAQETRVWTELNTDPKTKVAGTIVQPADDAPEAEQRTVFNFFSNSAFYCFLRWFQMVYDRLATLKSLEEEVTRELKLRKPNTTAVQLGLVQARMVALGLDFDDDANHYQQLLALAEQLIEGTTDQASFEDMLRYIYGTKAFKVYTIDKLVGLMAKQIQSIVNEEKNVAQTQAFTKDRVKQIITPREQIIYRIQTETTIGQNEQLYRHEWNNATRVLRIQHVGKDDASLADAVTKEEAWKYYIDSWTIAKPTYGVPQDSVKPCLDRNLQHFVVGEDEAAMSERYQDARFIQSHLQMKVCINTYKIFYVPHTEDRLLLRGPKAAYATQEAAEASIKEKAEKFHALVDERLPASVKKLGEEDQLGRVFKAPPEEVAADAAADVEMADA